jgi:hypothetical protein
MCGPYKVLMKSEQVMVYQLSPLSNSPNAHICAHMSVVCDV